MQRDENSKASSRIPKVALGVMGALVLSAIGSGLWEIFFRPGLTHFGNFLTSISDMADRAVYTTAALDPTPVPSLVVLLLLVQVPAFFAMFSIHEGFIGPILARRIRGQYEKIISDSETHLDRSAYVAERVKGRIRLFSLLGMLLGLFFFVLFLYAYTIENRAVLVWRVFHQNLDICRPYLSENEQTRTLAVFRSMNSSADFRRIREQLDKTAATNKLKLDWRDAR